MGLWNTLRNTAGTIGLVSIVAGAVIPPYKSTEVSDGWSMHGNVRNPDNTINYPGFVFPLVLSHRDRVDRVVDFRIESPYKFGGKNFGVIQNLNPQQIQDAVQKNIKNRVDSSFVNKYLSPVLGNGWDRVHVTKRKVYPEISSISVAGHASPEGHSDIDGLNFHCSIPKTSNLQYDQYNYSWVPGCIDAQNITLAKGRAEDTYKVLETELKKIPNISLPQVDKIQILGIEDQFSNEEVGLLTRMAFKHMPTGNIKKGYNEQKKNSYSLGESIFDPGIWDLIIKTNRGQLKGISPDDEKLVVKMLESKRYVQVRMVLKNGKDQTCVFPLPLGLLALLLVRRPRSKKRAEQDGAIASKETKGEFPHLTVILVHPNDKKQSGAVMIPLKGFTDGQIGLLTSKSVSDILNKR